MTFVSWPLHLTAGPCRGSSPGCRTRRRRCSRCLSRTLCAPFLNWPALLSVGDPLIITILPDGLATLLHQVDERLPLQLSDLLVVERHVVVDRGARDEPVVGDHRHLGCLGVVGDRRGGLAVDRVEHEHVGALGEGRLSLLLLLGRVLVGVGVDDLAGGALGLDRRGEQRAVLALVASGLGLRQQQGDLLAGGPAPAGGPPRGGRAAPAAGCDRGDGQPGGEPQPGQPCDGRLHDVSSRDGGPPRVGSGPIEAPNRPRG